MAKTSKDNRFHDVDLTHHKQARLVERLGENWVFSHRLIIVVIFAALSILLAWQAAHLRPDASFHKMVPQTHPYIANYLDYETELNPLTNVVRVAVETTEGDIYTPEFLTLLRQVSDEVFYIRGVDRGNMRSLWTPNVHWYEVTDDGMRNGPVIPSNFAGTAEDVAQVRTNVLRAGVVGSLVAADHASAVIQVPLLEVDPLTGDKLDYGRFSAQLEDLVRAKYESATVRIHIVGFAKVVGDLIEGIRDVAQFFLVTVVLSVVLLYWYSRCWRSTASTVFCCLLAVVWQLGMVRLIGLGLDPYSVLVPFLTFAIGVSHAVQNINTMAAEKAAGSSDLEAAKSTFRVLFIPGTIALVCDAVGFSTLLVIDIGVIRELALSASIGVAVVILTKMFLLPVLMSFVGVTPRGVARNAQLRQPSHQLLSRSLSRFASPGWAVAAVVVSLALLGTAFLGSRDLKIGDLDPGAPELRKDSRYNLDSAFLTEHYATSSDVFVVMVTAPEGDCGSYPVAALVDQFQHRMEDVAGVESTDSLFTNMKKVIAGTNGAGDLRWYSVTRNRYISNAAHKMVPSRFYNTDCSMTPVVLYLADHKAETLTAVVQAVEAFAAEFADERVDFLLAGGNAGVEAATNIVIKQSEPLMLALVYGIVALLILWEFRSWRVTVAIVFPLFITSMLCEAIMAKLGLGVKVATLPVVALGVGIGVDYGIYIYNRLEDFIDQGLSLHDAYRETLKTTGQAVAMTGLTLALGVFTWVWSSIKFQADMGLLLTFMFLWNMIGALIVLPALVSLLMPHLRKGKPGAVPAWDGGDAEAETRTVTP